MEIDVAAERAPAARKMTRLEGRDRQGPRQAGQRSLRRQGAGRGGGAGKQAAGRLQRTLDKLREQLARLEIKSSAHKKAPLNGAFLLRAWAQRS